MPAVTRIHKRKVALGTYSIFGVIALSGLLPHSLSGALSSHALYALSGFLGIFLASSYAGAFTLRETILSVGLVVGVQSTLALASANLTDTLKYTPVAVTITQVFVCAMAAMVGSRLSQRFLSANFLLRGLSVCIAIPGAVLLHATLSYFSFMPPEWFGLVFLCNLLLTPIAIGGILQLCAADKVESDFVSAFFLSSFAITFVFCFVQQSFPPPILGIFFVLLLYFIAAVVFALPTLIGIAIARSSSRWHVEEEDCAGIPSAQVVSASSSNST